MIAIVGFYQTKFGELWHNSLFDLVAEACNNVLIQAEISWQEIDAVFFANMLAGVLENNLHSSAKIAEIFNINKPIYRVESACASGGIAVNLAFNYLKANSEKTVLVIGAEKMTDYSSEQVTYSLSSAASGEEQESGLTFPGVYALMANFYLNKYKYSEEDLAWVSIKNHYHGFLNPKAHFNKTISLREVLESPYVAYPLKILDSSPISDGAAALVITNKKKLLKKITQKALILSSVVVNDTISLTKRKKIDEILATRIASNKAFKEAKVTHNLIDVAEVHDCFSIAEILAMEDLGFWRKGEGGGLVREQITRLGNNNGLVVNTSGGLKAAGHPVGATGVKQIGELFLQLTNQAGLRQVKGANFGLAQNVGGSGGTAVVTILSS